MNESERNYYMVRANKAHEYGLEVFFENDVVAVGWSKLDISGFEDEKNLRKAVKEEYYSDPNLYTPWVSKKINEVARFFRIKEGDRILVPFHNGIRIAEATSTKIYDKSLLKKDLSNQIEVKYLKKENQFRTIPRKELMDQLQRRLRVRGATVTNLIEFKDQIDKIFETEGYTHKSNWIEKEEKLAEKFKKQFLKKIQEGKTNLAAGGQGLEELIMELMKLEGFDESKVLPKNKFKYGDADVIASNSSTFGAYTVLIQAKHHKHYSDNTGINQLIELREGGEIEADEYVFITTANVSPEVNKKAEEANIQVMNGERFIDWLYDHLEDLNNETKVRLGLITVPHLV